MMTKLSNFFNPKRKILNLDMNSGEGLVNVLLPELAEMPPRYFKQVLDNILMNCINVNRSFADAIEFLSIWFEKSPDTLLKKLADNQLKNFFNRTMYHLDGDQWPFAKLLEIFSRTIKEETAAKNILHDLFENFDFVSKSDEFIRLVIGYNRLECCVNDIPAVFKIPLLEKIQSMIDKENKQGKHLDLGHDSFTYLTKELNEIKHQKKVLLHDHPNCSLWNDDSTDDIRIRYSR